MDLKGKDLKGQREKGRYRLRRRVKAELLHRLKQLECSKIYRRP
jgi:hypothetical protein